VRQKKKQDIKRDLRHCPFCTGTTRSDGRENQRDIWQTWNSWQMYWSTSCHCTSGVAPQRNTKSKQNQLK